MVMGEQIAQRLVAKSQDSVEFRRQRRLPSGKLRPLLVGHPTENHTADFTPQFLHHVLFNMDQRESMLQLALADLESSKYTSIRQAAKAYGIPRSTLANRQNGKPLRSVAYEQQRLTPASRGIPY